MLMELLPEVIFRLMKTFLSNDDYHCLLNTSQQLFGDLKRKTIYFHLNVQWSIEYIEYEVFQRLLLNKVENGWEQIGICLSHSLVKGEEIPADLPIHTIIGVDYLPLSQWNNYKSIKFRSQQSEIPLIPNVRKLTLPFKAQQVDLTPLGSLSKLRFNANFCLITDITPLSKIPDLTISGCFRLTDFSVLSSQRYLRIYNCSGLSDASSFRSIHKLVLHECHNFSDVSALYGVYDLTLLNCKGVKDISKLGNHHCLDIGSLEVADFSCFLHVPHVRINNCPISDASVLRYAKSVALEYCLNISDVSVLKNAKKVEICSQERKPLLGLEELGEVPNLYLNITQQETKDDLLSCLKNPRLSLRRPVLQITSLSMFSTMIEHLTIANSEEFAEFVNQGQGSLLRHLKSITLKFMSIETLEGLGDIPTVSLLSCNSLRSLDGLGRNRCVEVRSCKSLEDVSSVATVPIVTIFACPNLSETSSECLKNVPRLKFLC